MKVDRRKGEKALLLNLGFEQVSVVVGVGEARISVLDCYTCHPSIDRYQGDSWLNRLELGINLQLSVLMYLFSHRSNF